MEHLPHLPFSYSLLAGYIIGIGIALNRYRTKKNRRALLNQLIFSTTMFFTGWFLGGPVDALFERAPLAGYLIAGLTIAVFLFVPWLDGRSVYGIYWRAYLKAAREQEHRGKGSTGSNQA